MHRTALLLAIFLLWGCGPKEIGEGSAWRPDEGRSSVPAEDMRFPLSGGNNTQQRLYYYTRPDLAQNYQNWQLRHYRKLMGLAPDPEDPAYREKPRQRSPFRQ